jgi:hypothetical protein
MSSFVTPDRLLPVFARSRFEINPGATRNSLALVRSGYDPSLFEWIIFETAGRENEAVATTVAISVTRHVPFFRLMELMPLVEIAEDQFRGVTTITDAATADQWLQRVESAALQRFAAASSGRGLGLLRRTSSARQAVERYLACVSSENLSFHGLGQLNSRCPPEIAREARRLAEYPGVLHVFGGNALYLWACTAILLFAGEVEEGGRSFLGVNPLHNQELMWRIQLLADRLLREAGK